MVTVKFKKAFRCCPDGKVVKTFTKADGEVELPDNLAESAVNSEAASYVGEAPKRKARKPVENKGKKSSNEDK